LDRAQEAHVGWMTIIDDGGGSVLQPSQFYGGRTIIEEMHDRDFEIIVRMFAGPQAKFDARMEDAALRLIQAGVHYIFWQNEPECELWDGENPPKDWVEIVFRNWVEGAYKMKSLGAYPGTPALTTFLTPDADGNIVNPFLTYITEQERNDLFYSWYAWVNRHIYPIHHPIAYPYDLVNQAGKHLTHGEYLAAIAEVSQEYRERTGTYWVWENWEDSENHINNQRDEGRQPGCTLRDDDVCWLSYRGTIQQLEEAGIADHAIILSTETGPCIGDKGNDGRYPRVTAAAQIRMVDQMLIEAEPPLAGLCFWLAGCQDLNATESNFERQSWWTHAWDEVFDLDGEIPLVQHLIDNPGGGELPPPEEPPEEPMPEPILRWLIPDWNDAENLEVLAEPGELVWKLIRAEIAPDNMANTVWIHALDEQGQATQASVIVRNINGDEFTLPHKPGEAYNQPMFKNDKLAVFIGDPDVSDIVSNIHGAYWDEPGVNAFHVGYILTFQEWIVPEDEDPEPPPPPVEITDDVIREQCWNNIYPVGGIRYNPTAAFQAVARQRGLGAPTTQEFDVSDYRAQGFSGAILYCVIGDWQEVSELKW